MEDGISISSFLIYLQSGKRERRSEIVFLHSNFVDAVFNFLFKVQTKKILTRKNCFVNFCYIENFVCVLENAFPNIVV